MLLLASTAGYLTSSFFSGHILSRIGVGKLLSLSCGAAGTALLGYTIAPFWWMMVLLAVTGGLGAGAIDAGLNTYAASNFSERVMQWLHASFGIGITIGPVIMTVGINLFYSWRLGYIIVGTAQLALALAFGLLHSVWEPGNNADAGGGNQFKDRVSLRETLKRAEVWLSILLFFVYSGIEASLGYWSYTLLTESRGISPAAAGIWVGSYWGSFTIGRILAGFFTKQIKMNSLIKLSLIGAAAGTIILIWNPFPLSSLFGVMITGFAIAPIFPGMVSLTSSRVSPKYISNTVGMQIASAGIGFSVIPAITGVIAQRTSIEVVPYVIMLCILLLFGLVSFKGSRQREGVKVQSS